MSALIDKNTKMLHATNVLIDSQGELYMPILEICCVFTETSFGNMTQKQRQLKKNTFTSLVPYDSLTN